MTALSQHLRDTLERYQSVKDAPIWRALADERRWVAWRFGPPKADGKRGKLPHSAVTGSARNWTAPESLSTLGEAFAFARNRGMDGVGIVPGPVNGGRAVWCGDLDDVASQDGEGRWTYTANARAILSDKEPIYVERSPSRRGLRTIALGEASSAKVPGVEIFGASGFVTATFDVVRGDSLRPAPLLLNRMQDAIAAKRAEGGKCKGETGKTREARQKVSADASAPGAGPVRLNSQGRRYVEGAVAAILDELRETGEGNRNHAMNVAGFAIGQLVGSGAVDEDDAVEWVTDAALETGLDEQEVATVRRSVREGMAQPRAFALEHLLRDGDNADLLDPWAASAVTPAPSFPKGVLPVLIERYARQAARIRGADEDAACALALLAMGAAAPADLVLAPRESSWRQPVAFFVGLVGPPGASKSPLLDGVFWPVRDFDAEQHRAFVAAAERAKAGQGEAKASGADIAGLALPRLRQRHLTASTLEGARRLVQQTGDGVILLADELQTFFGSFDRYTPGAGGLGGSDRASWLSAYDGKTDAIARSDADKSMFLARFLASVIGGTQPAHLSRILPALASGDGLLERFIWLPLPLSGASTREAENDTWRDHYGATMRLILDCSRMAGASVATVLRADAEAINESFLAEEWAKAEARKLSDGDPLVGFLMKGHGTVARLAATLHLLRWADGVAGDIALGEIDADEGEPRPPEMVSGATVRTAEMVFRTYLLPAARHVLSGAEQHGQGRGDVQALARVCLRLPQGAALSRSAAKAHWNGAKNDARWRDAVEALEAGGWLEPVEGRRGGGELWKVADAALERFADRR